MVIRLVLPLGAALLTFSFPAFAVSSEAPTGFDDESIEPSDNIVPVGVPPPPTPNEENKKAFDKVEDIADGLGPVYNAQSCRECHQNPVSGAASQIVELRAGHLGKMGQFIFPSVPIIGDVIKGRTFINDRAICEKAQEHVPPAPSGTHTITTNRLSLNLFGDGFIEALEDKQILDRRNFQCDRHRTTPAGTRRVCGVAQFVEILEAPGESNQRLGRFGWKNQHASLLSFAADAYLNEMGITNGLIPDEITTVCNPPVTKESSETTVTEPNDQPEDGIEDIDLFASFMRSRKAPPRFMSASNAVAVSQGEQVFKDLGCELCHAQTMSTLPSGTMLNGGKFKVTDALGDKTVHPFSDFLLHDVGTGDGIALAPVEHYGPAIAEELFQRDLNKLREFINQAQDKGPVEERAQLSERELSERVLAEIEEVHMAQTVGEEISRFQLPFDQPDESTELTEMRQRDECNPRQQARHVKTPADQVTYQTILCATHRLRTPPLWGLHQRSRLMHDANSLTIEDAIERHQGEAAGVTRRFKNLPSQDKINLLIFLGSL